MTINSFRSPSPVYHFLHCFRFFTVWQIVILQNVPAPKKWETGAAAAAVDTRGYCSTIFFAGAADWLSGSLARTHTHTHAGAADAVHACHKTNASSITEKAARNQMGLTAANTMTINCMKYSRLANVNWRCVWAARTWGSEVVNLCFKHHQLTTEGPFRHIRPDLFAKPWICLGRSHSFLLSPGTRVMIWFVLRPLGPGERERDRERGKNQVKVFARP